MTLRCEIGTMLDPHKTGEISSLASDPLIGKTVAGKYEVLALLGRGGMGTVYKARSIVTESYVALKMINPEHLTDAAMVVRFMQEGKVLAALRHPNIVMVKSVEIFDERCVLVMEYVEGKSLSDFIEGRPLTSLVQLRRIFGQIGQALAHAHSKGVIHRDVKPANILVSGDLEGQEVVKLVDFGVSKLLLGKSKITTVAGILGSPTYMSPEQFMGLPVDGRSDIYSLGCVMYEAIAGSPPFDGESPVELAGKHLSETIPAISSVEFQPILGVVEHAAAKAPANRYQTAEEFVAALEIGETAAPRQAKRKSAVRAKFDKKSRGMLISVIGLAIVLFTGLMIVGMARSSAPGTDNPGVFPLQTALNPVMRSVRDGEEPDSVQVDRLEKSLKAANHQLGEARTLRDAHMTLGAVYDKWHRRELRDNEHKAALAVCSARGEPALQVTLRWAAALRRDGNLAGAEQVLYALLEEDKGVKSKSAEYHDMEDALRRWHAKHEVDEPSLPHGERGRSEYQMKNFLH